MASSSSSSSSTGSTSWISTFNRFLPFATPGTPLVQDCIHLAAICLVLYFAPQIQERIQQWRATRHLGRGERGGVAQEDRGRNVNDGGGRGNLDEELDDAHVRDFNDDHMGDRARVNGRAMHGQENANVNGNDDIDNDNDNNDDDDGGFLNLPPQPPAAAGPAAGPAGAPNRSNIGAKKAKSLARRDQRRAHNEFLRSQGEAQRAREAAGASEREAIQSAERARRQAIETQLEARKKAEREAQRSGREEEWRAEVERRGEVVRVVRAALDASGRCDVAAVADALVDGDEGLVEGILRASGLLTDFVKKGGPGKVGEEVVMLTEMGWVVRVSRRDLDEAYEAAMEAADGNDEGTVEFEEVGRCLEKIIKNRDGSGSH